MKSQFPSPGMDRVLYLAYNAILLFCFPLLLVYLLFRLVKGKSRAGFSERMGGIAPLEGKGLTIWVHAVSVGEVTAARPVVAALREQFPQARIVFSTITPTGQALARKSIPGVERFFYFPFDLYYPVRRALEAFRPALFVFVETELWPNFLYLARQQKVRTLMVNGRLSDKGFWRSRRARFLFKWIISHVDRCLMQSELDAERIRFLGAGPGKVEVYGNTKFDQDFARLSAEEAESYRCLFGWSREHPVLIAGSTHPGEEEAVIAAYRNLSKEIRGLCLLIAPRHIERSEEIAATLKASGLAVARRTELTPEQPASPGVIILLDTIGELARIYGLATVSFVGGSLVPIGGHDILQPIAFGVPAVFGPYMHNFRDISSLSLEAGVGFQIRRPEELAETLLGLLKNSALRSAIADMAGRLIERNRGASHRYAQAAAELLGVSCR